MNKNIIDDITIVIIYAIIINVARVRRRGDRPPHSQGVCVWKIWGDKEFLSLISGK
jgi:hypothetical protein